MKAPLVLLISAYLAQANPVNTKSSLSAASCQSYTIPVDIKSSNLIFSLTPFKSDLDVVSLVTDFASRTSNTTFFPFEAAPQNQSASYQISARFCTPTDTSAPHRDTVILATHGLGFDKSLVNHPPYSSILEHALF
jgi:hypothetical protein